MPPSDDASYERLHVTPLDAELLKVVLSSSLLPKARNISFHTVETFPDKRYGFLELPNEDAEKLKKKLNGSVLRGVKIRIGTARPSSIPIPLADAAMAKEKPSKKTPEGSVPPPRDQNKKRKRGAEELSGIVLDAGRKIKRGWTSTDDVKEKRSKKDKEKKSKEKKKQPKSKYTDHPECLVKTVLPANATPLADTDPSPSTDKKKKRKNKAREVVIHEFERTTKFPTFLKAAAPVGRSGSRLEFVDGKGWVDEYGEVVEAVKAKAPPTARVRLLGKSQDRDQGNVPAEDGPASSNEDEDTEDAEDAEDAGDAEDLESESASSAGEANPPSKTADSDACPPSSPAKLEPPRPRSSGSAKSLSIRIPPATPNDSKVHPLEALYKRTKQTDEASKAVPTAGGFSFFDEHGESAESDADNDVGEASAVQVPLTPFTRQDLESRGIRSAAPTPDTAHPNRRFTPWEPEIGHDEAGEEEPERQESQDDEESPLNSAVARAGGTDGNPTSDFQKWFWGNRGDLNRSWKKRRKVAGKEKRYRENKARMARAI
ncbi:hypothetical protein C8A05DRAFT_31994 [Staphylotrichum tortipilum]|uniref:Nucleotide-binding, alpha-beta plait n=1 Tax=Staphylotrichum tortipilum TaxID=2831512 RepID=A0AAN6MP29_9PEZI|nr:hypothetical protein C8A05DRAFT_31994 [Staphylotrichum longicolle]